MLDERKTVAASSFDFNGDLGASDRQQIAHQNMAEYTQMKKDNLAMSLCLVFFFFVNLQSG